MSSAKILRTSLRQRRNSIYSSDRNYFAKKLFNKCQQIGIFKNSKKIAIYLVNDGEIDTKYINSFLQNKGVDVYLPVLAGKSLKFAKIGKKFKKNRFGIKEPLSSQVLTANNLNIIFVPLVGFDSNKNRMGMGGGFYDRTLQFKTRQQLYRMPKLYGLAFECQKVDKIKVNPWDIMLDAIITPSKIYS